MELLEILYERSPYFSHFYPRRYDIQKGKILLKGMSKSGITSLICDFLSNQKKGSFLYANLDDLRLNAQDFKHLQSFIKSKNIETLVLENFKHEFILPEVENIILSSHFKTLHVNNFTQKIIWPLNFEEFVATGKNFELSQVFNSYAKLGRLGANIGLNKYENRQFLQDLLKNLLCEKQIWMMKILASHVGASLSKHQIFQLLKENFKLSKDQFYFLMQDLEDRFLINFVPKFNSPNSPKKFYFTDFAFKHALSFKKDWNGIFQNMIFAQLQSFDEEIFYTNELHFYLPQKRQALLAISFLPNEILFMKFAKLLPKLKDLGISRLKIITLSQSESKSLEGVKCEIVPFWNWALSL